MNEQNEDVQAAMVDIDSVKLLIDGVSIEKLAEFASDIKEYGVRKNFYFGSHINTISDEVTYLLAGYKLSAGDAVATLDKAKECIMSRARLYRSE